MFSAACYLFFSSLAALSFRLNAYGRYCTFTVYTNQNVFTVARHVIDTDLSVSVSYRMYFCRIGRYLQMRKMEREHASLKQYNWRWLHTQVKNVTPLEEIVIIVSVDRSRYRGIEGAGDCYSKAKATFDILT